MSGSQHLEKGFKFLFKHVENNNFSPIYPSKYYCREVHLDIICIMRKTDLISADGYIMCHLLFLLH